jgi:hypothetical protein
MLYLVEAHPTVERAKVVDAGEGPGPVIAKIVERFRPQAIYGNPIRRFGDRRRSSRTAAPADQSIAPAVVDRHRETNVAAIARSP